MRRNVHCSGWEWEKRKRNNGKCGWDVGRVFDCTEIAAEIGDLHAEIFACTASIGRLAEISGPGTTMTPQAQEANSSKNALSSFGFSSLCIANLALHSQHRKNRHSTPLGCVSSSRHIAASISVQRRGSGAATPCHNVMTLLMLSSPSRRCVVPLQRSSQPRFRCLLRLLLNLRKQLLPPRLQLRDPQSVALHSLLQLLPAPLLLLQWRRRLSHHPRSADQHPVLANPLFDSLTARRTEPRKEVCS